MMYRGSDRFLKVQLHGSGSTHATKWYGSRRNHVTYIPMMFT